MTKLTEHIVELTKKSNIAYFTSNMLIDNDKLLKEGVQETSAK